jgi:ribosome-binding ATPase YchF (GTP1/OBG family)
MCSRFSVWGAPAHLWHSLKDVANMKTEMNLKDLKDLESFEKKILKEHEKRTREEAKNYLRLLAKGAESI